MIDQLFVNGCILVTLIFISSQIFRNTDLSSGLSKGTRVQIGIIGGLAIVILIHFSIHITPNVVMDFRHVVEVLAASIGGPAAVMTAGGIAAVYRLLYEGVDTASIVSSISILAASAGCAAISSISMPVKARLMLMLTFCMAISTAVFSILIGDRSELARAVALIWISSFIAGGAVYYLVRRMDLSFKMLQQLKRESSHDFLTSLKNARQFESIYSGIINSSAGAHERVSILMLDIDHFKNTNDTYGHIAGDIILREFGKLLSRVLRDEDTVARIGGEEFSVILTGLDAESTKEVAERLRAKVEAHEFRLPEGASLKVTVSIGIAVYPLMADSIENLKRLADQKLYEAKQGGRNRVCI
jgi:diguanylate cyclase